MGAPAYKVVRQSYPNAHIQLLVDAEKASFASQIPFVDGVLTAALDKSLWSPAKKEEARWKIQTLKYLLMELIY